MKKFFVAALLVCIVPLSAFGYTSNNEAATVASTDKATTITTAPVTSAVTEANATTSPAAKNVPTTTTTEFLPTLAPVAQEKATMAPTKTDNAPASATPTVQEVQATTLANEATLAPPTPLTELDTVILPDRATVKSGYAMLMQDMITKKAPLDINALKSEFTKIFTK